MIAPLTGFDLFRQLSELRGNGCDRRSASQLDRADRYEVLEMPRRWGWRRRGLRCDRIERTLHFGG
jgi:hypothetical protein